jgi:butyryl-CoA dehydrogenase
VEQHYRDNRLNPIHEGTNGIQAIDLLGRKAVMAEGRALRLLIDWLGDAARRAEAADLVDLSRALDDGIARLARASTQLAGVTAQSGASAALAYAGDYMEIAGTAAFTRIWADLAVAAARKRPTSTSADMAFYDGKISAAQYVIDYIAPRGVAAAERIARGQNCALIIEDQQFG